MSAWLRNSHILLMLLLTACAGKGLVVDLAIPEAETSVAVMTPLGVLAEAANSDDPTPRGKALAWLIAASTEPAGGEYGPRGAYDPSPWVQHHVVRALADRLPEPESATALNALASRTEVDPYVRAAAAMQLARHGHNESRDALHNDWKAESTPWNRAPLAAGALAMGDSEALEPLARVIRNGELPLEIQFLADLGASGLTELLPALQEGEKVAEAELTLAYAAARVALGDPAGESALRRALASENVELRLEALDYLSQLPQKSATSLIKKARSNDSSLVRSYANFALAARGETTIDKLISGSHDDDFEVRLLAIRFVGESVEVDRTKRDLRVLREVLTESLAADEATMREASLVALVKLGFQGQEADVQRYLVNEDMTVRVAAAGALLLAAEG